MDAPAEVCTAIGNVEGENTCSETQDSNLYDHLQFPGGERLGHMFCLYDELIYVQHMQSYPHSHHIMIT